MKWWRGRRLLVKWWRGRGRQHSHQHPFLSYTHANLYKYTPPPYLPHLLFKAHKVNEHCHDHANEYEKAYGERVHQVKSYVLHSSLYTGARLADEVPRAPRHDAHSSVTRALRNVNVNGPDGAA